jgi:hypothetical protein
VGRFFFDEAAMLSLLPFACLTVPLPAGALARIDPGAGPVFAVAFSSDGKRLVSAGADGLVRLWDVAAGKEVHRFKGHAGAVKAVAWSHDGRTLLSGDEDKMARLWDVASGRLLHRLDGHDGAVEAVALSPDGKTAASAGRDGCVRTWQTATGKPVHVLRGHRGAVHALAFAPHEPLLVSAGRDRTVRWWQPVRGKQLRLTRGAGWVFAVGFAGAARVLAFGGLDQMVHLVDPDTAERLEQFGGYEGPVRALALTRDGRMTAAGGDDARARLWENETGKVRRQFAGHRGPVWAVALAPEERRLASAGDDGVILIWDVTGRLKDGRLRPANLSAREWRHRWADLGSGNAETAFWAMGEFLAAPDRTVPLFRERLEPILEVQVRVRQLIATLESTKYAERRRAMAGLEELGELALPTLRQALEARPPLETRLRLEQFQRRFQRPEDGLRFSARLQVFRAIEVLERIGTPAARKLLGRLAEGLPVAWGQREAKASLARLRR